jgi:hypothetical protein
MLNRDPYNANEIGGKSYIEAYIISLRCGLPGRAARTFLLTDPLHNILLACFIIVVMELWSLVCAYGYEIVNRSRKHFLTKILHKNNFDTLLFNIITISVIL